MRVHVMIFMLTDPLKMEQIWNLYKSVQTFGEKSTWEKKKKKTYWKPNIESSNENMSVKSSVKAVGNGH